jgi:hypothetical protein
MGHANMQGRLASIVNDRARKCGEKRDLQWLTTHAEFQKSQSASWRLQLKKCSGNTA